MAMHTTRLGVGFVAATFMKLCCDKSCAAHHQAMSRSRIRAQEGGGLVLSECDRFQTTGINQEERASEEASKAGSGSGAVDKVEIDWNCSILALKQENGNAGILDGSSHLLDSAACWSCR